MTLATPIVPVLLVTPCKECGGALHQRPGKVAPEFCSTECRKAFNNRRAMRGAQLYDLMMVHTIERQHPKRKNGETRRAIDRLVAYWRDIDRAEGRVAYNDTTSEIDCGSLINPRG